MVVVPSLTERVETALACYGHNINSAILFHISFLPFALYRSLIEKRRKSVYIVFLQGSTVFNPLLANKKAKNQA